MKTACLVSGLFIVAGCSPHARSPVRSGGAATAAVEPPEQVLPSLKGVADVRRLAGRTRRGGEILQIGGVGMATQNLSRLFVHAGLQRVYATAWRGWENTPVYVWRGPTSELQWEGRFDRIALRPSTGGFWGSVPRRRSGDAFSLLYVTPTFGRQEVETEELSLPSERGAVSHDESMFVDDLFPPLTPIRVSRFGGPHVELDLGPTTPKRFDSESDSEEETSQSMRFVKDDSAVIVATNKRILRWEYAGDGRVSDLYVSARLDSPQLAAVADVATFFENGQPWLFDWKTAQTTAMPLPFQFAEDAALSPPTSASVVLVTQEATLALSPRARYVVLLGYVKPALCENRSLGGPPCKLQSVNGVYEVATGRLVLRLPALVRHAAFSEVDEVLAVADSQMIYWVDLRAPKPMAEAPVPSTRFVAWPDAGKALLRVGEANYYVLGVADHSLVPTKYQYEDPDDGLDNPEWVMEIDRGNNGTLVGYDEYFPCKDGGHLWIKTRNKPARTYQLQEACKGWDESVDQFVVQSGLVVSLRYGRNAEVFDAEAGIRLADIKKHAQADHKPGSTQSFLAAVSRDGRMIGVIDYRNEDGPVEDWKCQMPMYSFDTHTGPACGPSFPFSPRRPHGYTYLLRIFRVPTVASAGTAPTLLRVDELGSGLPTTLAFADGDRNLLVGFEDGTVTIHPTNAAPPFRREALHRGAVMRFEFAPGGRQVMSRDEFGQELLWQP